MAAKAFPAAVCEMFVPMNNVGRGSDPPLMIKGKKIWLIDEHEEKW